jgi:hypothetical protein
MDDEDEEIACEKGVVGCESVPGWAMRPQKCKVCTLCIGEDVDAEQFGEVPAGNLLARVQAARRAGHQVILDDNFDPHVAAEIISEEAAQFIPKEQLPGAKPLVERFNLEGCALTEADVKKMPLGTKAEIAELRGGKKGGIFSNAYMLTVAGAVASYSRQHQATPRQLSQARACPLTHQ